MSYRVINQTRDLIELQTGDLFLAKAFADRLASTTKFGERFAVVELKLIYESKPKREDEF